MRRNINRLALECPESRRMLSGQEWFENTEQQPGQNSLGVPLGDLDGDGDLDSFVSCYAGPGYEGQCHENVVWLNDGQGAFRSGWSAPATNVLAVALVDLDADGDLDAFVVNGTHNAASQPKKLWLNDGWGNFDRSQDLGTPNWGLAVSLGDLDGDGDLDAIVGNLNSIIAIWR